MSKNGGKIIGQSSGEKREEIIRYVAKDTINKRDESIDESSGAREAVAETCQFEKEKIMLDGLFNWGDNLL